MGVESVAGFKQVLNKYDTKKWVESADFKIKNDLQLQNAPLSEKEGGQKFSDFLANSITKVNEMQHSANEAVQKLAAGESKNLHETLLAVEQAEIAFKTMNQLRLKVMS